MKLLLNILLGFVLLLGITSSEGCKSNKVPAETVVEEVVNEDNPLDALLAGLHPLTEHELNGRMVTIDGVSMPVYDEKGKLLKGDAIIALFRDESKIFKIYGAEDLEPKAVLVRDRVAADDIVVDPSKTPIPGEAPMETKLEYAPAFKAQNMQGEEIELDSLKGKVVVLNFWFTQCKPCVEEMPELNALVKKYKEEEVVFLAITHDSKQKVAAFLEKESFNYDIIPDAQQIINDYIVMGFPTNIVLDKKGDIQYQSMGFRHKIDAILNDEIRHALKKKDE